MDLITLELAKRYVDKALAGLGSLKGKDGDSAYDIAKKARRGYYREHGMDDYTNQTLSMLGFDDWFGSYIRTTQYMSTKALAVLELKYSIILNWYQIYYPRDYQQIIADYYI